MFPEANDDISLNLLFCPQPKEIFSLLSSSSRETRTNLTFGFLIRHCVVFGEEIHSQNFNVYNINEVITQIYNRNIHFFHDFTNSLFSE